MMDKDFLVHLLWGVPLSSVSSLSCSVNEADSFIGSHSELCSESTLVCRGNLTGRHRCCLPLGERIPSMLISQRKRKSSYRLDNSGFVETHRTPLCVLGFQPMGTRLFPCLPFQVAVPQFWREWEWSHEMGGAWTCEEGVGVRAS